MQPFRIGFGYDVHRLSEGDILHLGGVNIPSPLKSVAHSDGDVLIHAICDALLGGLALRDIGYHFPDTDSTFKGIDSKILLKKVNEIVIANGYKVGNIDSTVILETPKINPFVDEMQNLLSTILAIEKNQISIKATTSEKIGFIGRKEGISAYAICLLYKI